MPLDTAAKVLIIHIYFVCVSQSGLSIQKSHLFWARKLFRRIIFFAMKWTFFRWKNLELETDFGINKSVCTS
jgi:hypothetical protein